MSAAANALGGGYVVGNRCPWSSVDVYAMWLETNASGGSDVVFSIYLKSLSDGTPMQHGLIVNKVAYPTAASGTRVYHEDLVASGVSVTAGKPLAGTFARYGTEAADTYEQAIGLIGLLIVEAA